jgi:hypothetical protein
MALVIGALAVGGFLYVRTLDDTPNPTLAMGKSNDKKADDDQAEPKPTTDAVSPGGSESAAPVVVPSTAEPTEPAQDPGKTRPGGRPGKQGKPEPSTKATDNPSTPVAPPTVTTPPIVTAPPTVTTPKQPPCPDPRFCDRD